MIIRGKIISINEGINNNKIVIKIKNINKVIFLKKDKKINYLSNGLDEEFYIISNDNHQTNSINAILRKNEIESVCLNNQTNNKNHIFELVKIAFNKNLLVEVEIEKKNNNEIYFLKNITVLNKDYE